MVLKPVVVDIPRGHIYETMAADNKIGVLVSLAVVGKYVRADIFVINDSPNNVDVSTLQLRSYRGHAQSRKPLRYVDGDKMILSAERRLALGNAMATMGADNAASAKFYDHLQRRHESTRPPYGWNDRDRHL